MSLRAISAALALALAPAAARASATDAPFDPLCAWDLAVLCPDVGPGAGRMGACLNERRADLSPACRAIMDQLNFQSR